jgi:two-component system chemotaxis response regulator CheB
VSTALATSRQASRDKAPRPRLMVVDDSVVARAVLSRMIEADGGFEIAAVAGTAEDAIVALDHVRVDVILLDLEMPGAGGLKSIPKILERARGARVLIVSSLAEEGAAATLEALAMGAADTLPKPGTGRFNGSFSDVLLDKLRSLAADDEPEAYDPGHDGHPLVIPGAEGPIRLLALGASTGGIHALAAFFQSLPEKIGSPILVTQHLPAPFMPIFARQLATVAKREVLVAEEGLRLLPDRVVIAPGDANLRVELARGQLVARLDYDRAPSGCLPSVDPMLASAGRLLGKEALGIVFSGIGRDGLEGAMALVAAGGSVMAQDQDSSAVWGMPRAIADAGLASAVLPPARLAQLVAFRVGEQACK